MFEKINESPAQNKYYPGIKHKGKLTDRTAVRFRNVNEMQVIKRRYINVRRYEDVQDSKPLFKSNTKISFSGNLKYEQSDN